MPTLPSAPLPVAESLRAIADPTRLRMLHLLRTGPLCVGDLVDALHILQPKASRHLAYLQGAGLIISERRGGFTFYGLAPARAGFPRKLRELLDAAAAELPQTAKDDAALRKLQKQGGCCPQHASPRAKR